MKEKSTKGLTPLTTKGLAFIKANKGTTLAKLSKGIKCSERTAARIKVDLVKRNLVFTSVVGKAGKVGRPTIGLFSK